MAETTYMVEVCTPSQVTDAGVNVDTPTGTDVWGNPNLCVQITGNGAQVNTNESASENLFAPILKSQLGEISDGAIITKIIFAYEIRQSGSSRPAVWSALFNSATQRSATLTTSGATAPDVFQAKTRTISSFINGDTISGAQLKSGNFGFALWITAQPVTSGICSVRATKVSVCYQNPDPVTPDALQMCEA